VAAWKASSSAGIFASRASDPILTRIDTLMAIYEAKAGKTYQEQFDRHLVLCEVFYALDAWLKDANADKKSSTKKARRPGVDALYASVAEELAWWYGTTVNVLPMELENHFGKDMVKHGATEDAKWLSGKAKNIRGAIDAYMSKETKGAFKGSFKDPFHESINNPVYKDRAFVERYRVFFKKGIAYQSPWWDDKAKDAAPVKLDTAKYFKKGSMSKDGRAGFVLSMSRDLYVGQHFVSTTKDAFYHSSYLAGKTVQCAGELKCTDGRITMISNYSGHYQPKVNHLLNLVQMLTTHGCSLKKMAVLNLAGHEPDTKPPKAIVKIYKAEDFLKKKGKMTDEDELTVNDKFVQAAV
jgi:hypothetical protein